MIKQIAFLALLVSTTAGADCFGTRALRTCTDSSGNTYTTQQIGSFSYTTGANYRTGSRWSQDSMRVGNTTYTTGHDADGNRWSETTDYIGGSTFTSGYDSDGGYFSDYDYE